MVEIEETNNVDSDIEIQSSSPQWPLQEGPKLKISKYQTQIPLRERNIYKEWEHPANLLQNSLW